jgi:hypothetical protein
VSCVREIAKDLAKTERRIREKIHHAPRGEIAVIITE